MSAMNPQKLLVQVIVGMILFTVIAVILEGNYSQEIWLEKGKMALLFGLAYGIFLIVKERFRKKN
jgi:prolipoprotein diacylglyceryltransferase